MSREVLYHKACGTQIGWWLGPYPVPPYTKMKASYIEDMDGKHPEAGSPIWWTCPKCGHFRECPGVGRDTEPTARLSCRECGSQTGWWWGPYPLRKVVEMNTEWVSDINGVHPVAGEKRVWACPRCGVSDRFPALMPLKPDPPKNWTVKDGDLAMHELICKPETTVLPMIDHAVGQSSVLRPDKTLALPENIDLNEGYDSRPLFRKKPVLIWGMSMVLLAIIYWFLWGEAFRVP